MRRGQPKASPNAPRGDFELAVADLSSYVDFGDMSFGLAAGENLARCAEQDFALLVMSPASRLVDETGNAEAFLERADLTASPRIG